MFGDKFEIVSQTTTKHEDKDPKLYAERFEIALKEKKFGQAIKEIDKAIEFSKNDSERIKYVKYKIDILYGAYSQEELIEYINKELNFIIKSMDIEEVINLLNDNIEDEYKLIDLLKQIININPYDKNILIKLSKLKKVKDYTFIYEYLDENIIKMTENINIEDIIKLLKQINLTRSQKLELLHILNNYYRYNLNILDEMIILDDELFVEEYINKNLFKIVKSYGLDDFIEELSHVKLDDKFKMKILKTLLTEDKNSLNILDEIIKYYKSDIAGAIEYVESLMKSLYKEYSKLSLIYLRKGMLFYKSGDLKTAKQIFKVTIKMSKNEVITDEEKGEILFNYSLLYCALAKRKFAHINYKRANFLYQKSRKYGYEKELPKDIKRDEVWGTSYGVIIIPLIIVLIFIVVALSKESSNKSIKETNYSSENDVSTYGESDYNYDDDGGSQQYSEKAKAKQRNYIDEYLENSSKVYNIYTNAYSSEFNANKELKKIKEKGITAVVKKEGEYYKVLVGNSESLQGAIDIKNELFSILNKEPYILVYDKNVEERLNKAKSYIDSGYLEDGEAELYYIKNTVSQKGYEGYKKEYDSLMSKINKYNEQTNIESDKSEIDELLGNMFSSYGYAVKSGEPEIMYPYVTYQGQEYKEYEKNIPNYYNKQIEVAVINYDISSIKPTGDGKYKVHCQVDFEITNPEGTRNQVESFDYIIVRDSQTGKLLVDKIENWKLVK